MPSYSIEAEPICCFSSLVILISVTSGCKVGIINHLRDNDSHSFQLS